MRTALALLWLLASCGGPSATPDDEDRARSAPAQAAPAQASGTAEPVTPITADEGPSAAPPPVEPPAIEGSTP